MIRIWWIPSSEWLWRVKRHLSIFGGVGNIQGCLPEGAADVSWPGTVIAWLSGDLLGVPVGKSGG